MRGLEGRASLRSVGTQLKGCARLGKGRAEWCGVGLARELTVRRRCAYECFSGERRPGRHWKADLLRTRLRKWGRHSRRANRKPKQSVRTVWASVPPLLQANL